MLSAFACDLTTDAENMELSETGWRFLRFNVAHIRFIYAGPPNVVGLGARKKVEPFHSKLASSFRYNVRDPNLHLPKDAKALCFPTAFILALEHKLGNANKVNEITQTQMRNKLNLLNYDKILAVNKNGIEPKDLPLFEKENYPFHPRLQLQYPGLDKYNCIAVNLYEIRYSTEYNHFSMFPIWLSPNHLHPNALQIDLLLDNQHIRPNTQVLPHEKHVLTILNLPRLLASFDSTQHNFKNTQNYTLVCRKCCKTYKKSELALYQSHATRCNPGSEGRKKIPAMASKRRCKNQLIHRSFIRCKVTGRDIRHQIFFHRSQAFKLLKCPIVSSLDLECTSRKITKNENLSCHSTVPKTATYSQDILAYSFAHKSLYSKHKLPDNLSDARVKIYDDKSHSQLELFHDLFTTMRSDIASLHDFFIDSLKKDEGTPTISQLTQIERTQFFLATRCSICKNKFGSTQFNPVTKKSFRVHKVIDHCHLSESTQQTRFNTQNSTNGTPGNYEFKSRLRFITCAACNLQMSLKTVNPKMAHTFWVHNGNYVLSDANI